MENSISAKLDKFLSGLKPLHYKKGEAILRGGDLPQGVYFLKSGYAKLASVSPDGEELTLVLYQPGDFFPVVWSFFGKRASIYSYEAMTAADLIRVPRQSFMDFLTANPDVLMEVTKHIITRFQSSLRTMEFLVFGNSSAKVASVLLRLGNVLGIEKKNGIEIQVPLTHRDIANIIGVTRETVSIELKRFANKGYIDYSDKLIVIKDRSKLESESILS